MYNAALKIARPLVTHGPLESASAGRYKLRRAGRRGRDHCRRDRVLEVPHMYGRLIELAWIFGHGCGSKMRTQNGTLVNGAED